MHTKIDASRKNDKDGWRGTNGVLISEGVNTVKETSILPVAYPAGVLCQAQNFGKHFFYHVLQISWILAQNVERCFGLTRGTLGRGLLALCVVVRWR